MKRKIILIPLETSSRELLYKIYLCNLLSVNNFECFLGKKAEILDVSKKIKNFIYLDKGFHKGVSESLYNNIKENSGYVINLDEEGAVAFPDGSPLHLRYSKEALSNFNITFFWGEDQLNLVKKNIPINNLSIVSGHPRFQLLKQDFIGLYDKEVKIIKSNYNDFILVNTNFARGNNIRGVEAARKNYIGRYKNIDIRIENDNIKLKKFISLVKKLTSNKYNVVIRPHPEEDINTYKKEFINNKKVHVTNEKSAISWILACKVLIHSDCTTGVESLMMKKKSISYIHPDLDKSVLTILPQKASFVLESENEILNFVQNDLFLEDVKLDNYRWLDSNFSFNKDSFALIVEEISKINISSSYKNGGIKLFFFPRKIKDFIKKIIGRVDSLIDQKLQDFNYNNIKNIQHTITGQTMIFKKNKITRISNNLYRFKKQS